MEKVVHPFESFKTIFYFNFLLGKAILDRSSLKRFEVV
jgi:hypothetical protein